MKHSLSNYQVTTSNYKHLLALLQHVVQIITVKLSAKRKPGLGLITARLD